VLPQVRGVPVVTLSALHRKELSSPIRAAFKAYDLWNVRITTAKLNDWLHQAVQHHPLPVHGMQRLRVRYMTQVKTRPPTFALFTSKPEMLPESYIRYLINGIRERFDLPGVPVRILLRKTKNPYGEEGTRGGSEDVDKRKKKVHPAKKAALKKEKKDKKNEKHGIVRGGKKKTGKPRVNHKKGKRP
ncbi:MAG: hypothetical protein IT567_02710, partial [Alphaproteobacteria bacterium]|nr:hypothetical protein [Alphaproteobacteria bacterium]